MAIFVLLNFRTYGKKARNKEYVKEPKAERHKSLFQT